MPYALVTFGGGPRLCIRIHFATIEVKVLAAHVLRSYRLEPVTDQPPRQIGFVATVIPDGILMHVLGVHPFCGNMLPLNGHSGWYSDACAGAQPDSPSCCMRDYEY